MIIKRLIFSLFLLATLSIGVQAQKRFVYDTAGTGVGVFEVSPEGVLSHIQTLIYVPVSIANSQGKGIALSPAGDFVYAGDPRNGFIHVYSADTATGLLTEIPESPFPTQLSFGGGGTMVTTPDNKFLYMANTTTNRIEVFAIAPNGALTPVPDSLTLIGGLGVPPGLKITPNGKFLALSRFYNDAIEVYSIASDGKLSRAPGSPFIVGTEIAVSSIDINCAGDLLFAIDGLGRIHVLRIATDGSVTPVNGSPFDSNALGYGILQIVLHPSGKYLFVINANRAIISGLAVHPDGSLTKLPGYPLFVGDDNNEDLRPVRVAIDSKGEFLYTGNGDSTAGIFSIAEDGMISPVAGSPFNGFGGDACEFVVSPPRICTAPIFDQCIQDESRGNILKINSETGEYSLINCDGFTLDGTAEMKIKGCLMTLQDNSSDRRLLVKIDRCKKQAIASIVVFSASRIFTIRDKNIENNSCSCGERQKGINR